MERESEKREGRGEKERGKIGRKGERKESGGDLEIRREKEGEVRGGERRRGKRR